MSKKDKYPKKPKNSLDSYHYHEALDRTFVVVNIVDSTLLQHPVIQKHKKFKKKINNIINDLSTIYQITGGLQCMKIDQEENDSESKD